MKYIIAFILILFASFADIFLYKIGLIPFQPSYFLLPLFLVICIIRYAVKDILAICKTHSFKYFCSILLLSIIYAAISPASTDIIIQDIVLNLLTILLYLYIIQFFKYEPRWLGFFVVFTSFAVLASSVWYDYFVGLPKFSRNIEEMVRKGGFGENPNQAASALKFLALCVLVYLQNSKIKRISFIIVIVASVFITFSRSGMISIILILILGISNNWKKTFNLNPQKLFISSFNMIFLFVGLYIGLVFFAGFLKSQFPELGRGAIGERIDLLLGKGETRISTEDVGTGGRGDLLFKYIDAFKDWPLGYGTGFSADRRYNSMNPHNYYLYIAIDYGFLALLIYFFYLAISVKTSIRRNQFYFLIFMILLIFEGLIADHIYFVRPILICLAFFDSFLYNNQSKIQD